MKKTNLLVKVCTVLSSVLLAGTFVSYSAGCFSWVIGGKTPTGNDGDGMLKQDKSDSSKPEYGPATPVTVQQPSPASAQSEPVLMPGSKSFNPTRFISGLTPAGVSPSKDDKNEPAPSGDSPPAPVPPGTPTPPPASR